jgi:transglutaminase-like putative cysteine protease
MSSTAVIRKSFFEFIIRMLFVVVPTMAVSAYVLNSVNLSYTGFDSGTFSQFAWLCSGILGAYILSWLRGRFMVLSLIVLLALWIGKLIIANMSGEFDLFYAQAKFWLYSTLFTIGWIAGFLINRSRIFVVAWCSILTLIFIIFLSQGKNLTIDAWSRALIPVFLYSIYMFYLAPQLLSGEWSGKKSLRWLVSLLMVIGIAWLIFDRVQKNFETGMEDHWKLIEDKKEEKEDGRNGIAGYNQKDGLMEQGSDLDDPENEGGGGGDQEGDAKDGSGNDPKDGKDGKDGNDPKDGKDGKDGKDPKDGKEDGTGKEGDGKSNGDQTKGGGIAKKGSDKKSGKNDDEDGEEGLKMKDSMKMGERQSSSDILMFCARLENYFPNGSPQPLYFVYHYLTKYDPRSETFVRDPLIPSSDELSIDPSKVEMYRTRTDSTAIKNSFATKKRKQVEADVFISSNVWKHSLLAPSAAYSVQTIPVDTGYKDLFRSGYHVKSYSSELNNAYFVYNPSANPAILQYQQERIDELSSVKDYSTVDSAYYAYYTYLPQGTLFDSIRNLAIQVTAKAKTPVEKVVAIRDYFLQKKSDGTPLYRYTLNPGTPSDPNIPTGSMLRNFLFETHEGYCTYYAGASTLMLQAVGVPARFTTGFATIDRSDKNKGWYWFYASQAHAWTQVYFPEYGWLDFDMTISTEEEGGGIGEAPKPDGTPPVPPPQPWLIIDGVVTEEPVPGSGRVKIRFSDLVFFNDEYHLDSEQHQEIDATLCRFVYGNIDTTFGAIHKGDSIFAVSWDDMAKDVPDPDPNKSIEEQMRNFTWPMIADEIYIQKKVPPKKKDEQQEDKAPQEETKADWTAVWYILLGLVGVLIIGVIFFPLLYLARLRMRVGRAHSTKSRAEALYRDALYTYHMSGEELRAQTALSYAEERADKKFGTSFAQFVHVYLRLKYSGLPELDPDAAVINTFKSSFRGQVRSKLNAFRSFARWFNIMRALRYFRSPEALTENVNKPYGES